MRRKDEIPLAAVRSKVHGINSQIFISKKNRPSPRTIKYAYLRKYLADGKDEENEEEEAGGGRKKCPPFRYFNSPNCPKRRHGDRISKIPRAPGSITRLVGRRTSGWFCWSSRNPPVEGKGNDVLNRSLPPRLPPTRYTEKTRTLDIKYIKTS